MPFPVFLFLLFFVAVPVQEFEFELVIIGHEVLGLPAGILRITVILCRFYRSVYLRCGSSGLGCCRSGSLRCGSSGLGCCRSGSLRCGSSGLGCCRSGSLRCRSSGLGCRRSGSLCRGSCLLACRSLSLHRSAALSGGLSCGTSLCSHFMHHFLATLGFCRPEVPVFRPDLCRSGVCPLFFCEVLLPPHQKNQPHPSYP